MANNGIDFCGAERRKCEKEEAERKDFTGDVDAPCSAELNEDGDPHHPARARHPRAGLQTCVPERRTTLSNNTTPKIVFQLRRWLTMATIGSNVQDHPRAVPSFSSGADTVTIISIAIAYTPISILHIDLTYLTYFIIYHNST
ncbi:hypothetical protein ALC53_05421 [Atta colombica]|uniref:Uncharacterized protein n=1 Tax=Atta colombica TaxID=520822 RepID=A0A195BHM8_9HYME|nr:hypothetical protein ALC53_05421 [Atta colombica]